MKRFFDLFLSIILLILLSPIILMTFILVSLLIGRPAIFKQERIGFKNKSFTLFKFRSMNNLCDADGNPLPDEIRLTKFGKVIRSLSIDELPSLINVLIGDMSLVGPRPLLVRYLKLYNKRQIRRHEVKPGITGWAQVNGRNSLSWQERFELDVWYVDNRSFNLDIKILFMTIVKVLKRDGISSKDNVTMQEFLGNEI